ncbi:23S rRNA (adenine(2503)-C(2))-methyltransferase RlmN [Buchnera aphidicola]|uniref:Dual-specificity RNA methyltransferase RlmN n=1 Tax=Buchnera aphidicola (Therioaphis trifolii) TaxID=1241884 RepID=A0A4D6YDQ2_9GAMM|nr:23S rRNA (adenine(2503)-C(2))-methyltransferase RlmN [Buchnera aphidicola]QCI27192.1 23S rRNA (adenine(2503)-C(2))-methyltransferase RlmN [Buchnera aphidicola (Therioaphis trifolii)]
MKILLNLNNKKKINLLNFDYSQMKNFMYSINEKPFRANQIMNWIYKHFCTDFNQMTNLKDTLKKKLYNLSYIQAPNYIKKVISKDHTIKWLFSVNNGIIETIYIPEKKRNTLCISSQIGCILKCKFCATGEQGFKKNLLVSEIIGQIWRICKSIKKNKKLNPITNIVFMGMGEPLLNLKNVIQSLKIIFDKFGFNISKKKVVLSTSGIIPAIDKLSNIIDVKLAVSLHASNDDVRNHLMPINKKYNIHLLLSSISRFIKKSKLNKNGITIEYIMLKNINDTIFHAKELIKLLKNIPSKINLIPFNNFSNNYLKCSTNNQINIFSKFLIKHGFITTIRKSRGQDIQAACGQLTGNYIK